MEPIIVKKEPKEPVDGSVGDILMNYNKSRPTSADQEIPSTSEIAIKQESKEELNNYDNPMDDDELEVKKGLKTSRDEEVKVKFEGKEEMLLDKGLEESYCDYPDHVDESDLLTCNIKEEERDSDFEEDYHGVKFDEESSMMNPIDSSKKNDRKRAPKFTKSGRQPKKPKNLDEFTSASSSDESIRQIDHLKSIENKLHSKNSTPVTEESKLANGRHESITRETLEEPETPEEPSATSTFSELQKMLSVIGDNQLQIVSNQNAIMANQNDIMSTIQELNGKVSNLENAVRLMSAAPGNPICRYFDIDPKKPEIYPCTSLEDFKIAELDPEEENRELLEIYLGSMGAENVRAFVSMAMKEILADHVVDQFTVSGNRGKEEFGRSKHAVLILRAARECKLFEGPQTRTEFLRELREVFRSTKQRLKNKISR